MATAELRSDLAAAQAAAWHRVTAPGVCWSGAERAAIARVALAALDDPAPLSPWVTPSAAGRDFEGSAPLPGHVVDLVYRLARHASSLTADWYAAQLAHGIDPVAYVELVAVVVQVAAVDGFHRAAGRPRPPLPEPLDGPPSGERPVVEPATLNWVPVLPPADRDAAVVQGLSAAADDFAVVRQLAAAQYIPFDEMADRAWHRGTLTRTEMEIVASRLSLHRECFY